MGNINKNINNYKIGDFVWIPSDDDIKQIKDIKDNEIVFSDETKINLQNNTKKTYNSLYSIFQENKIYIEETLNNIKQMHDSKDFNNIYLSYIKLFNTLLTDPVNSKLARTLRFVFNPVNTKKIEKISVNAEKEKEKIKKEFFNILNNLFSENSIKAFIKPDSSFFDIIYAINKFNIYQINDYKKTEDLKDIQNYFNALKEKIQKHIGIFLTKELIEQKYINQNNYSYFFEMFKTIDFNTDLDFSEFQNLKTEDIIKIISFIKNINKIHQKNKTYISYDETTLTIENILVPLITDSFIKNKTSNEIKKILNYFIEKIEETAKINNTEEQDAVNFLLNNLLDNTIDDKTIKENIINIKMLKNKQKESKEIEKNDISDYLDILNIFLSVSMFRKKIEPQQRKETIIKIIKILNENNLDYLITDKKVVKKIFPLIFANDYPAFVITEEKTDININDVINFYKQSMLLNIEMFNEINNNANKIKTAKDIFDFINVIEKKDEILEFNKKNLLMLQNIKHISNEKNVLFSISNIFQLNKEINNLEIERNNYIKETRYDFLKKINFENYISKNHKNLNQNIFFTEQNSFFFKEKLNVFAMAGNSLLFRQFFEDIFQKEEKENSLILKKNFIINALNSFKEYLESNYYNYIDIAKLYKMILEQLYYKIENEFKTNFTIVNFFKEYIADYSIEYLISLNDYYYNSMLLTLKTVYYNNRDYEYIPILKNLSNNILKNKENNSNFEKNLFNISFLTKNNQPISYIDNFFYKIIERSNFILKTIIFKNFILENLANQGFNKNYIVGNNTSIENIFLKKNNGIKTAEQIINIISFFEKNYNSSLKEYIKETKDISFVKEIFDNLKYIFKDPLSLTQEYKMIPIFSNGKEKLYQQIIETNIKTLISDIFLNGITYFGQKEKNFILKTFLPDLFTYNCFQNGNKWIVKNQTFEKLLINKGILIIALTEKNLKKLSSLLIKHMFEKEKKNFFEKNIIKTEIIKKSLKNLVNNLIIPPIPNESLKNIVAKEKAVYAKIMTNEDYLFGIEGKIQNNKESFYKIQTANTLGLLNIKNILDIEGLTLKKEIKNSKKNNQQPNR